MPQIVMLVIFSATFSFAAGEGNARGEEKNYDIHGYYKSFFTVFQNPLGEGTTLTDEERIEGTVSNTLRLKLFLRPADSISFHLAYAVSPILLGRDPSTGSELGDTTGPYAHSYRLYDLRQRLYPQDSEESSYFVLQHNLDRFFATFTASSMDVTIGRQPIAFGSSRVINPTDVLVPFTFQTLDKEERTGVDALRVRMPIGAMGEFDAGYVVGDEAEVSESALFMRLRSYVRETDLTLMVIGFRDNLLGGIDIAKAVGGASVWFEAAYTLADLRHGDKEGEDYLRLSVGADYNLKDGLYGFLEYHYNGAGTTAAEEYFSNADTIAYTEGGVYLLAEHYIAPGLAGQLTPLISCSGQILMNLTDPSAFIAVSAEYNVAQDVFVDLGAFISLGEREKLDSPQSEFGLYPSIYYSSIRLYF